MKGLLRSGAAVLAVVCGVSLATTAEARGHSSFSLSVGVPLGGYYGYGYGPYAPFYRPTYYGYGWYGGPYVDAYYVPRPVYYLRPYSQPYSYGPVVSLALFPSYVGDGMTTNDRAIYSDAYRRALAAPVGQGIAWNTDHASGSVTTTRDGWAGQKYCREFRQSIAISGQSQDVIGTACRAPGGDWQLVQNQPSSTPDPY